MKPTSDKVFLDTNILVYAHTDVDANKQVVAQQLMVSERKAFISTQVIQELANTLNKKFKISWNDIIRNVDKIKYTIWRSYFSFIRVEKSANSGLFKDFFNEVEMEKNKTDCVLYFIIVP